MENNFHRICGRRWGCMDIYKQIGYSRGPSVFLKVIIAFLMPLLIFIAAAIVGERIFSDWVHSEPLRMLLVFLMSVLVTAIYVFVIKLITSQPVSSK
jgi:hypothetical protein